MKWSEIRSTRSFIVVVLLMIADGSLLTYEDVYLPWYRFPHLQDLPDICFWVGVTATVLLYLSLDFFLSVFEEKPDLIPQALNACAATSGLILVAALVVPPAYILYKSRIEFLEFPRSREVRAQEAQDVQSERPLFVLLSDVHVTDQKHTLEGFPPDKDRFQKILTYALSLHPQYLVISGDLTDRGKAEEWKLFDSAVSEASARIIHDDLLFLPGNHDIQGAPEEGVGNKEAEDSYEFTRRFAEREHLFYEEVSRLGNSFRSTEPHSGAEEYREAWAATEGLLAQVRTRVHAVRIGPEETDEQSWVEYPEEFGEVLERTVQGFDRLFPLIDESHLPDSVAILLNSNSKVSPGGSMGLGSISAEQLSRLRSFLEVMKRRDGLRCVIVALHHAPIRHQHDEWHWREFVRKRSNSDVFEHTFLALDKHDAAELTRLLDDFAVARKDVTVVLLHGHRHQKYLGKTCAGVWVVEAPAVIENEDGFWAGYSRGAEFQVEWIKGRLPN